MIEVNFIITVYDKEEYWPYLKDIINKYKNIKSNFVVCYSGIDDNFDYDIKIKNLVNGGRGNNHHVNSCSYADMDYDLTIKGYEFLKKNNVKNWIKLSVDSWLLDEKKLIEILNFMNENSFAYGGNIWYSHINLSTDIFFANTQKNNIFEDLKLHGKKFLDWLYEKKIPTGFENLMRYVVIPYDHFLILDREFLEDDNHRHECGTLGWCMFHKLENNINFMKKYKSDNNPPTFRKIKGNDSPYSFEWYLLDSGQN
jgi:hypothetical protein